MPKSPSKGRGRARYLAVDRNGYGARFVQTVRQECLDRFLVCGGSRLNHLSPPQH